MSNIIELRNVNRLHGIYKTQVLYNINIAFESASFNAIIGPSGSGKSTLLNILGTLDSATSGDVLIDNINIKSLRYDELVKLRNETIGFIFQSYYLLPEFTALENILMPYRLAKRGNVTPLIMRHALELINLVGINNVKDNLASKLSSDQQQRVAIARSLINYPKIVLADEPTGALDSESTEQIYNLFRKINDKYKTAFIIVTNDRHLAERADRIVEMKNGYINLDITR